MLIVPIKGFEDNFVKFRKSLIAPNFQGSGYYRVLPCELLVYQSTYDEYFQRINIHSLPLHFVFIASNDCTVFDIAASIIIALPSSNNIL
jgi:hypothetical protein